MAQKSAADTVYCRDCGSLISARAEICPECGVRQRDPPSSIQSEASKLGEKYTDQYPLWVWVISVVFAAITFPFGLVIPAYFYYMAEKGAGENQSTAQMVIVILFGILGIAGVEIHKRLSEKDRKHALYAVGGLVLLAVGSAAFAMLLILFG